MGHMVWNATMHVGTALTEIIVTRLTGPVTEDAVLDTWGICAKHVNTRSVIQIFGGLFSKPIYSETCLIKHAMEEQFCFGIVSVSDYTVQKINRKTVKKAYKST